MRARFADTSFFVAYLNRRDENHRQALEYLVHLTEPIVTTTWVLLELGNYLAGTRNRRHFVPFVQDLRAERRVRIVPVDEESFERALRLYRRRPDKHWSLTDCLSFLVMQQQGLVEALTADHHFKQAGFTVLLGRAG